MSLAGEKGSSRRPATPAVTAKPAIIMTHTIVAAAGRRAGATSDASSASSEVPEAATPMPTAIKASAASASPNSNAVCMTGTAAAAPNPPRPSSAMPPMIQGVRRPPTSEPKPMRGRDICTP